MSKRYRVLELAGITHRSKLLTEGEEEELFGDDEGGDEEETEDKPEEEEEDKPEEEKEEEPLETIPDEDIAKYGPGEIDMEIDSILKTIFDNAAQSGPVKSATSLAYPGDPQTIDADDVKEAVSTYRMKSFLLEEIEAPADQFNLDYFTAEVARYIKNYQTLLDMEGMLFNKARQFLINQFGPEMEAEFVKMLALAHDLDFENTYTEDDVAPVAVGGNAEAAPAG